MYTIISEDIKFSWRIFDIVQQQVEVSNGKIKIFEKAVRSPWTRLIIIDNNRILLTREYRIEIGWYDYRLPGGKVFDTGKEYNDFLNKGKDMLYTVEKAALKEAQEEVWIIQSECTFFAMTHAAATIDWDLYYFILKNPIIWEQSLEEGENITYDWYSIPDVITMCMNGAMQEERSCIVLLRLLYQKWLLSL